jgi:hypothetical protein
MTGYRINVYIKNDAEKLVIKEALRRNRLGLALSQETEMSPAQKYMLDSILNAINNMHGAQHPNTLEPVEAPVIKPKVDFDKLYGLVED